MERFKAESMRVNGAPECMRVSGFMHGITNPDLIKRLNDNIPKSVDEMMSMTTTFLREEVMKSSRRHDRFTPRIKTPKEILAIDTVKFKAPPSMSSPAENRNKNKFCEFHRDKGHSTDEWEHLKAAKKGETPSKEKAPTIFMVQPWQRVTRQRITQSFSKTQEISFPPLTRNDGQETPMVVEAEIGGHLIHRMYIDGGSASEVLYEHCFNKLHPEVKR
ncbi:hypothetical protein Tco_1516496 [Tanacetum coccineum]